MTEERLRTRVYDARGIEDGPKVDRNEKLDVEENSE